MSAPSSSKKSTAAGGEENIPPGSSQASTKKTNVCLICGIYTNLSINIFEPRTGPNICEVIYQKYNFKAERGDNEDKFICYSCNNWLINWHSLQNLSESRSSESTQASNRSQPDRNKHSKSTRTASESSQYKEHLEQDNQVSSTVKSPEKEKNLFNIKRERPLRPVLKETMHQNLVPYGNNNAIAKTSECALIQMLQKQGTSVTKEIKLPMNVSSSKEKVARFKRIAAKTLTYQPTTNSNDIIISFDSTISEAVEEIPSLKLLCHADLNYGNSSTNYKENESPTPRKLSRSFSISLISPVKNPKTA